MVCFNQEERVVGLMSEVCPFLKEMKGRDRDPLRSLVQIVPQGPHGTQGPVFFEFSVYNGS